MFRRLRVNGRQASSGVRQLASSVSEAGLLTASQEGPIATLTLTRPQVLNALSSQVSFGSVVLYDGVGVPAGTPVPYIVGSAWPPADCCVVNQVAEQLVGTALKLDRDNTVKVIILTGTATVCDEASTTRSCP